MEMAQVQGYLDGNRLELFLHVHFIDNKTVQNSMET